MAADVVVVGSCMTDLVRLVPGGGSRRPAADFLPSPDGGAPRSRERGASRCPGRSGGCLRLPRAGWAGMHPDPGVRSLSRPGEEKRGRRRVRRRGALGPGRRAPRRGVGCGRGRGKEQNRPWGWLGPGDVSPANNTLKEGCGNGEKFERVVCWSFDQLSLTLGRRETWVCIFICARWLGISLARKAAFHSNPHGKS